MAGVHLPVRTYTTADGLPSNRVNRIVRDARGYLWFCTRDGLSRFDGYQFTNFGVAQGLPRGVYDLVTSLSGAYWVATSEGLARFDTTGHGPLFTLYRPPDPKAWWINALADDGAGGLWCGTDNGLYHFKRDAGSSRKITWTFVKTEIGLLHRVQDDREVTALLRDRSGTVWVGSFHGLFRGLPDGSWKLFSQGLPHPHVTSLLQALDGGLWVGTWHGLCLLSVNRGSDPVIENTYQVRGDVVLSLFESADKTLWVGTDRLSKLTRSHGQEKIEMVVSADSMSVNGVGGLAEDGARNLWAGSSAGVLTITRGGFTRYGIEDGLDSNWIMSLLLSASGQLCAVTKRPEGLLHINCFDGHAFQSVLPNVPYSITHPGWGSYQLCFQDYSGAWWVPAGEYLLRYPAVSSVLRLAQAVPQVVCNPCFELGNNSIFRLFKDSRGNVWMTGGDQVGEVAVWQRADGTLRHHSHILATAFAEDRSGNVWVENGLTLSRFREGHEENIKLPKGTGSVHSLFVDREGRLWAGGGTGLLRIDSPDAPSPDGILYTKKDGLASDDISGITQDTSGRLYVATGNGIDSLYPTTPLHVTHYSKSDGLAEGIGMVALRDSKGSLWFGNDHGLMRLDPLAEEKPEPPPVAISEFKIRGVRHTLSALGETEFSGLELPASENQLEVGFVGLEFRAGKKLSYQYQLEGAGTSWSPPTTERSVNYASLSPGSYRFLVRAINNEGLVSAKPASLSFTIIPPVWQRAWFRLVALVLFAAILYALYRYRLNQLLQVERIRARIATDLHDDIGSTLSQISILSEVACREIQEAKRVESLQEIAELSRHSMESMSDIVWAIDPEQDRVEQLANRMRRFASNLSTADGVRVHFEGPTEEKDLELDTDMRRQMFLIFKESLHNALRHSGCKNIDAHFQASGGRLTLTVQDDGRGFDPGAVSRGHGLVSIEQRARILGGKAEIVSQPGKGTLVRVNVPLNRGRNWPWFNEPRTKG